MSGAGSDVVNGNYYDTGEVFDDFPVYRNDNGIYFFYSHDLGWWNVSDIAPTDFAFDFTVNCYYGWGDNALPNMETGAADSVMGTWVKPVPTLTEYTAGTDSGSTGSTIRLSGCGTGYDGDYALSDYTTKSGGPIYINSATETVLYHLKNEENQYWFISNYASDWPGSYYFNNTDFYGVDTLPIGDYWATLDGVLVEGMKTELVDSAIPDNAVLKVSGFPIDAVNGYYWQTNTATEAYAPIYTNGEYALFFIVEIGPGWVIAKGTGNTSSNLLYLSDTAREYPYEADFWGDIDVMNPSDTSNAKVEKL